MKKIKLLLIQLALLFVFGCGTGSNFNNYLEEVRYSFGTIHNINKNIVTLTDGSTFKLNRFLIAVNMSPVVIILPSYTDETFASYDYGYMFVDGTRYQITNYASMQVNFFRYGYYEYAENIAPQKGIIKLTDGSKWLVKKDFLPELNRWTNG